jgi:hypothetical protein
MPPFFMRDQKCSVMPAVRFFLVLYREKRGKEGPFYPSFCEIMQVFHAIDNDARLFFCFSQKKR